MEGLVYYSYYARTGSTPLQPMVLSFPIFIGVHDTTQTSHHGLAKPATQAHGMAGYFTAEYHNPPPMNNGSSPNHKPTSRGEHGPPYL